MSSTSITKLLDYPFLINTKKFRWWKNLIPFYVMVFSYRYYMYNQKPDKSDLMLGLMLYIGYLSDV